MNELPNPASAAVAIRTRELTKVYRLYTKPIYRFFDMFGLMRARPGRHFTEHAALYGMSIEIRKGEKVAIIGRNGAGKSTFLRLVTGVVEPTSGAVEVSGRVHALLQIGTGFHPDFTGRQNVHAYLAQLAIVGREAEAKVEEIVAFAELEEYIDQPVKTYSTGMGVRLMFATSTAISPDLLVLDEVLGVGDAYFAQKSYERVQELCEGRGTTLLLVTHDVYSALRVCDRFVWLDRGRVVMDGDSKAVVQAYEQSIRAQEEHRLRLKRVATLQKNTGHAVAYGQIRMADGQPPAAPVFIGEVRITGAGGESAVLPADGGERGMALITAESNWSEVEIHHGRPARRFEGHGSIFHKLPFVVTDPGVVDAIAGGRASVEVCTAGGADVEMEITVFTNGGGTPYTARVQGAGSTEIWSTVRGTLTADVAASVAPAAGVTRYGGRAFEITDVRFLDQQGHETMHFAVGAFFQARLAYRINDASFDERPTIILAFQKDGIVRTHRFWTNDIRFSAGAGREGTLTVSASPLLLGAGTYAVTVSAFRESYFAGKSRHLFFSGNPDVLDMHSRGYEVVVQQSSNQLLNDVVFQHQAEWELNGTPVASTVVRRDTGA